MLEENKPYSEPPFAVFSKLKDRRWVAQQHQFYWTNRQPLTLHSSTASHATFIFVPPASGSWQLDGKLGSEPTAEPWHPL